MILPVLDFLPNETRRVVYAQRSKRRIALLGVLLLVFTVGVSAHSWNSARIADSERSVGAMLAANTTGVDDLLNGLAKEQSNLSRALRVSEGIVPPISVTSVLATVTNILPEFVSLTGMRLDVSDAPHQMVVVMNGVAQNTKDIENFEHKLAGTSAFRAVTLSESKTSEFMGKRVEEFTVSFQVPLFAQVSKSGSVRVAQGGVN